MNSLNVQRIAMFLSWIVAMTGCGSFVPARDGETDLDVTEFVDAGPDSYSCSTDEDCDDGVPCTSDLCLDTQCHRIPMHDRCDTGQICMPDLGCSDPPSCTSSSDCDDGYHCNGMETCNGSGECTAGVPPDCLDDIGCTEDACDETTDSCIHRRRDEECQDDSFCTLNYCDDLMGCFVNNEFLCDDDVHCTQDACDESGDECIHVPDHDLCPDTHQCRPSEAGDSIGCVYVECDGDDDCDDGLFCNGTETCNLATHRCESGEGVECGDDVECTLEFCDESADTCLTAPVDGLCDDDDPCTVDQICDPGTGGCTDGMPFSCPAGEHCEVVFGEPTCVEDA